MRIVRKPVSQILEELDIHDAQVGRFARDLNWDQANALYKALLEAGYRVEAIVPQYPYVNLFVIHYFFI